MILDRFNFADGTQLQNVTTKTFDFIYDFGTADRAGEGYPFEFWVSVAGETTATGNPKVNFILESADDTDFTENVTEHVMFADVPKTRLCEDAGPLVQRLPYGVRRYARLKIDSDVAIACAAFFAGIAINAQQNSGRLPMAESMTQWAPTIR